MSDVKAQIYALTAQYGDEEVESLYEEITKEWNEGRCNYDIIMGDFNAIMENN